MNIRDINEKYAKCYYSVSSLDIPFTQYSQSSPEFTTNSLRICGLSKPYPRHELVRDLTVDSGKDSAPLI